MTPLPYRLDRIITIEAPRELVFRFLTTSERWAAWWGAGSDIDPRPGGRVRIVHPGGVEIAGEVLEVDAPAHMVFTYGNVSGAPIPPGGSRVQIRLEEVEGATRLHLTHEFADERVRGEFVQGWRFQLSLFANVVTHELHASATATVDGWFALWADPDADARSRQLAAVASPSVTFQDRFSHLEGSDDVLAHITAAQKFMPGLRLERTGAVRQCQGTAIADWTAVAADGTPRGAGVNVFTLGADGRIRTAVGFWNG